MIDKEYVRAVLNKYADVAIELTAIKQEVMKERDIFNDEKFSWIDQDTIQTFLKFGMTRLLDEYIPRKRH